MLNKISLFAIISKENPHGKLAASILTVLSWQNKVQSNSDIRVTLKKE